MIGTLAHKQVEKVVQLLLHHGADPFISQTAEDYALERKSIRAMIRSRMMELQAANHTIC